MKTKKNSKFGFPVSFPTWFAFLFVFVCLVFVFLVDFLVWLGLLWFFSLLLFFLSLFQIVV